MDAAAERLKENIAEVPADKQAALAALKEKLGNQNPVLTEKLDPANKSAVLTELRGLSRMVTEGRVRGVTKKEIDEMHDDIEGAMLVSTRPVEGLAQQALDSFGGMNPELKKAVIATGAIGSLFGLRALLRGTTKAVMHGWDTTLDVRDKIVTNAGRIFSWLMKTVLYAGAGALAVVGVQRAMAPGQAPTETPKKAV